MAPVQAHILPSPPTIQDFTPLSEHESATPVSFFGGKPVLHAVLSICDLLLDNQDLQSWDVPKEFAEAEGLLLDGETVHTGLQQDEENQGQGNTPRTGGGIAQMRVLKRISGFVTSSSLILCSRSKALSIPYPSISLHATQRVYQAPSAPTESIPYRYASDPLSPEWKQTQAVYLQLDMDPEAADLENPEGFDDERTVEMLLVPQIDLTSPGLDGALDGVGASEQRSERSNSGKVKEIFEALSRCADLNPDPMEIDGEEGDGSRMGNILGGLGGGGTGEPGEGGWITADNVHEYTGQFERLDIPVYDASQSNAENEEANLGPGAGSRRLRESEEEGQSEANGLEETKWQRT